MWWGKQQTVEYHATAKDRQPTAPRYTVHVDERTTAAAASNRTDGKDGGGEYQQTVEYHATAKDRQPTASRNTVHVDERTTTAAASNRTNEKDGGGEQKQTVECRPGDD